MELTPKCLSSNGSGGEAPEATPWSPETLVPTDTGPILHSVTGLPRSGDSLHPHHHGSRPESDPSMPLYGLPSPKEMAKLLILYVFCVHGIPVDNVLDFGPQFYALLYACQCHSQSVLRQQFPEEQTS